MCSWGREKVEVLSLGEWERKRLSGLSRGEREEERGLVILKKGLTLREKKKRLRKNQREKEGRLLREKLEKRKEKR